MHSPAEASPRRWPAPPPAKGTARTPGSSRRHPGPRPARRWRSPSRSSASTSCRPTRLRGRLPHRDQPALPPPRRRSTPRRPLRAVRGRHGGGERLQRAERPGRPAGPLRGPDPGPGRRRRGGHALRRGLRPCAGARHAPHRRGGDRHRPRGHAAHRLVVDPRRDPVPAAQAARVAVGPVFSWRSFGLSAAAVIGAPVTAALGHVFLADRLGLPAGTASGLAIAACTAWAFLGGAAAAVAGRRIAFYEIVAATLLLLALALGPLVLVLPALRGLPLVVHSWQYQGRVVLTAGLLLVCLSSGA